MLYEGKLVLTLDTDDSGKEQLQRVQSIMNIDKSPAFITFDLFKMLPVLFDEAYEMPVTDARRKSDFEVYVPLTQYEDVRKTGKPE